MALEGNLTDFSLSDMFHLLQSGSKSGVLRLEGERGVGTVCFDTGRIYYAANGGAGPTMSARLAATGLITDKQLRQANGLMRIQKKDKAERRLGQVLVDEGYLDRSALEAFVRESVADALFELLRWEEGSLRFESNDSCPEQDLGVSITIDEVMADVAKRLELWNSIREKIPSMDGRFEMAPMPSALTTEIHLKPREWMVLCHLHTAGSVREISRATGYGEFETARVLYGMFTNGLVTPVGAVAGSGG